jgi:allophanate hydrolase
VLEGPDPTDPWSRTGPPAPPGTRVAVPADGELEVDAGTAAVFAAVAGRCAVTARIPLGPLLEAGDLLYGGPWVAERLAGLETFVETRPDAVLPVTRAVLERGRDFDAVATFQARHRLQELRAWCARLWERADLLLLPTVPTTFTRAEIAAQPVARNLVLGRYTQFTNLLDLAAIAVPVGFTAAGRPVGVTLFGPAFAEDRLITAAHELAGREAA